MNLRATLASLEAEVLDLRRQQAGDDPIFAECRPDPVRFSTDVLGQTMADGHGNSGLWRAQREIVESVRDNPSTFVHTGNMVGKTVAAATVALWFHRCFPDSLVIMTGPTNTTVETVAWKELSRAYYKAVIPLGGRMLKSPVLKLDRGAGWQILAYSTNEQERFSGQHAADLLFIADEASGVPDEIYEAARSLKPTRELLVGNPLRPSGTFYERCARPGALGRVIHVSSLAGPHVGLARSPWGLADATWLQQCRNDYGEGSLWWKCHVEGVFPDSSIDGLLPISWLYPCVVAELVRSGPTRTAIDLAEGGGGDRSVVLTRDDNGILDLEHSTTWPFETTAAVARRHTLKWGVDPRRVTYDIGGCGADFANRLAAVGLVGAQPYRGGASAIDVKKYGNLRSAAAWHLRQRLDPDRTIPGPAGKMIPQTPFAIRPEYMALMREELQGLRYTQDSTGRICLEIKEDFAKRLRHSPDFADTLAQSFAFLN